MGVTATVIDVAHDLNASNDPEWMALLDGVDVLDRAMAALVDRWEARLTSAAQALNVTVNFIPLGSPESFEWARGMSDEDLEEAAELAAKLWGEA